VLTLQPAPVRAWAIGSQLNERGCHERITAAALRAVRARFDTAPVLAPSRNETTMIESALFTPPEDFVHDLAGMTLMFGVRDNDLKGINPLSSLDLIQVHGNPMTQHEHCIRSATDDGTTGDQMALAACRAYIAKIATEALDGLDASGKVDSTRRMPFSLHVAIRGQITPALPLFYVKIGAAMHALEDGFPHTYRTADGTKVTVVLDWIHLVNGTYDEARDGPPHRAELDRCWDDDPTIRRNYDLATQAATELLSAALDPTLDREQKIQQFDIVTAKYLTYEAGCTFDTQWCDPAEATVTNSISGCNASGQGALALWSALALLGVVAVRRHWRDRIGMIGGGLVIVAALATPARADDPQRVPLPCPSSAQDAPPAVAITPAEPDTKPGQEPGRDVKPPAVKEVAAVRAETKLDSRWGFAAQVGGSIDRTAVAASFGARYWRNERWLVGLDAGWNPWITTSPMKVRAGVATVAATLIRRFPMRDDRFNLRTSLHLGTSTLLFDVYGAPKYSTGPYAALSVLGIEVDLGHAVRLVCDPIEMAFPVPLLGQLPLYYEQFRLMIGIQVGS